MKYRNKFHLLRRVGMVKVIKLKGTPIGLNFNGKYNSRRN